MPRTPINYENTIIYKLICRDVEITEIYVGHTTNFVKRKQQHKCNCIHTHTSTSSYYVYEFIREHGGWDNWDMIEICKVSCTDVYDASRTERQYIESLGATLNKVMPTRSPREYCLDHKEEIAEKKHQYHLDHIEEITEKKRQYYLEHKEELLEKRKQYRDNHKEEIAEKKRQCYLDNRDARLEQARQYRIDHADELREKRRINRLNKKSAGIV